MRDLDAALARYRRLGFQVDTEVGPDDTAADLIAALRAAGEQTQAIVAAADLAAVSGPGGRFADGDPPPTLAWILIYVLQEYARHAGHLDIARELIDGATGE